jgi:hypothetical protein
MESRPIAHFSSYLLSQSTEAHMNTILNLVQSERIEIILLRTLWEKRKSFVMNMLHIST